MYSDDVNLIVGGGQAALRAAQAMREAAFKGRIIIIGEEALAPYERPPLSKKVLTDGPGSEPAWLMQPDGYAALEIDLRTGIRATAICRAEHRVHCGDGSTLSYDRLLLATGSAPRRMQVDNPDDVPVFYLRTYADALAIAERLIPGLRVAIVGGGFIGLEVAAAARKSGAQATVIEQGPTLLGRFAPLAAADFVARVHRNHGVTIRTGSAIHRLRKGRSGHLLELLDGSMLEADMLVAGIGIVPETGLAQDCGIDVADGILTDATGRTSDPAIFAAGDVARQLHPLFGKHLRLESWQNAQDQGTAVGRTMAGQEALVATVPWAWSDQFDLNIQVAGLCSGDARPILRAQPDEEALTVFCLEGDVVAGAISLNRGKEMALIRRLVAGRVPVDSDRLADPAVPLRALLP